MKRKQMLVFTEREAHRDLRFRLHRISVQQVRPVFPLPHRIQGGWSQHWMTRHKFEAYDVARLANHRLHHYGTLDPRISRQWRINWWHLANEEPRSDALRNADSSRKLRCSGSRVPRSSCAAARQGGSNLLLYDLAADHAGRRLPIGRRAHRATLVRTERALTRARRFRLSHDAVVRRIALRNGEGIAVFLAAG